MNTSRTNTMRYDIVSTCRAVAVGACLATAAVTGGCGVGGIDGIELQGGVFDALGVSGSGRVKTADAKVPARPGLVLPPAEDRLPDPNAPQPQVAAAVQGPAGEAWPVDPEDRKAAREAELEKRHRDYCERAIRNAELSGDSGGVIMGPKGNCQTGAFGSLTKLLTGKSD